MTDAKKTIIARSVTPEEVDGYIRKAREMRAEALRGMARSLVKSLSGGDAEANTARPAVRPAGSAA